MFSACMNESGHPLSNECSVFDFNSSGFIDLKDFAAYQVQFRLPQVP
jgi:hypothetical protein